MNIVLKRLHAIGFLSLGDVEINLSDRGFVLVEGINNNHADLAKSNGSGKSSIWSAICYALTGETINGVSKNLVNMFTDTGCSVELEFSYDNVEYKVVRTRDFGAKGATLKLFVNNEDKSGKGIKESEQALANYLPDLTSQLLSSVIILGQGLPNRFSSNTPSGRKEVLERLTKSDFMIEDIRTRVSERLDKLNDSKRQIDNNLLTINTQTSERQRQLDKLNEQLKEMSNIEGIEHDIAEAEKRINEEMSIDNELSEKSKRLHENISDVNKKLMDIKEEKSQKSNEIKDKYYNIEYSINKNILENQYKAKQTKDEFTKLDNMTGICPTCHQPLKDFVKPDTASLHEEYDRITKLVEECKDELAMNAMSRDKELEESLKSYASIEDELSESIKKTNDELSSIDNDMTLNKRNLSNDTTLLASLKEKMNQINAQMFSINDEIKNIEISLKSLNDDKLYNLQEGETISRHIDVVNKMMTYVKRDFRGELLRNIVDYLNAKSKEYSKYVFGTTDIVLDIDGNNLNISYCGKQYEVLSGGEKQKVDIVIQFSIRDMLCKYLNFSSNILVLDEILDNLDSVGCQNVMRLISDKLTSVDSLFIISHHSDELSIPYDSKITIVKNDDGVSHVKEQ